MFIFRFPLRSFYYRMFQYLESMTGWTLRYYSCVCSNLAPICANNNLLHELYLYKQICFIRIWKQKLQGSLSLFDKATPETSSSCTGHVPCCNFEVIKLFDPTLQVQHTSLAIVFKLLLCDILQFFVYLCIKPPHVPKDTQVTGNAGTLLFAVLRTTCVKSSCHVRKKSRNSRNVPKCMRL